MALLLIEDLLKVSNELGLYSAYPCVPFTTAPSETPQTPNERIPAGGRVASAHTVIYLAVCLCRRPSLSLHALYFVSPLATSCAQGKGGEGLRLGHIYYIFIHEKKDLLAQMGL